MNDASQRVSLLVDLAPLVDGDAEAEARYQGLLKDNPAANQLAQDVHTLARRIGEIGADFAPGADFEKRLVWSLVSAERRRHSEPPPQASPPPPSPDWTYPDEPQSHTRAIGGDHALPDLTDELQDHADERGAEPTLQQKLPALNGHLPAVYDENRPPQDSPEIDWEPAPSTDGAPERIEVRLAQSDPPSPSTPSSLARVPRESAPSLGMAAGETLPPRNRRRSLVLPTLFLAVTAVAAVTTLYWPSQQAHSRWLDELRNAGELLIARVHGRAVDKPTKTPATPPPPNPLADMTMRAWPTVADDAVTSQPSALTSAAAVALTNAATSETTRHETLRPKGLNVTKSTVRTPALLIAELGDPHQQLVLGRSSQLQWEPAGGGQLHVTGALLVSRDGDAPPLTLATAHALLHVRDGVVAVRTERAETLVAVLRGEVNAEPKQDRPVRVTAGSLLRLPLRGPPATIPVAESDGLLADFVPWPAGGRLGQLVPAREPADLLRRTAGDTLFQGDNYPWLPRRHAVRMRLSEHNALVEVTETFIISPGAPPLRYQRPLPPGATPVPADVLSAEPATLPPASVSSEALDLGWGAATVVEPLLQVAPLTEVGPILELTTRHLVPLLHIGRQRVLDYTVSGPAVDASGSNPALGLNPIAFTAEVRLQGDGELRTSAPFATRARGGKVLTANAAIDANGLNLRILIDSPSGDGDVHYSAVEEGADEAGSLPASSKASHSAPATHSSTFGAIGTLSYRAPRAATTANRQHWAIIVDDSYSMNRAARELVAPFVGQLLSTLPSDDQLTLLRCALECQTESAPPRIASLPSLGRWLAAPAATRARGGFDLGHALLTAQALHKDLQQRDNVHIVVLSRKGGSAGTLDAASFLQLNQQLPRGKPATANAEKQTEGHRSKSAQLPVVSVVQLGQADAANERASTKALRQLGRQLGGHYARVDNTLFARRAALALLRYRQHEPLREANLSLLRAGKITRTLPLPNLGGESDYQTHLPPLSPALDGAILTGRLSGQPFEHRYTLPAPPSLLPVSPETIAYRLARRVPDTPDAVVMEAETAIESLEQALKSSRKRPRYRPNRLPQELLDLTRGKGVPLPWETAAKKADRAAGDTVVGRPTLPCPPAPPEQCRRLQARWAADTDTITEKLAPALLQRLGKAAQAIDAAIRLAALYPLDAELQLEAGQAYLLRGEDQWACPHLQRAAELSGQREHLQAALGCWSTQAAPEAQLAQRLLRERLEKLPAPPRRRRTPAALTASAVWGEKADTYDLGLVDHGGHVYGLLDGTTELESATAKGKEQLEVERLPPGVYTLELWRHSEDADGSDSAAGRKASTKGESVRVTVATSKQRLNLHFEADETRTELARLIVRPPR